MKTEEIENLIERVELYEACGVFKNWHFNPTVVEAKKELKQLKLCGVINWVACKDELPEDCKSVILYLENKNIIEGYRLNGRWVDQYERQTEEAIYWQELPEPPCL